MLNKDVRNESFTPTLLEEHCFVRRCRAARKDFLAARRAAFRASAVSGSSSLDPSSSGRTLVTPGIHDLNEFKIAEKFLRIELSSKHQS